MIVNPLNRKQAEVVDIPRGNKWNEISPHTGVNAEKLRTVTYTQIVHRSETVLGNINEEIVAHIAKRILHESFLGHLRMRPRLSP